MTLPRVLLADDHTLVLEGFRRLLDDQCELVGTVGDGRALLEAIPELKPDIVILDISMPVLNGIDAARVLKVKFPQVKEVFITMHADPANVRAAFEAGASAYLLKRCVGEELGQAIRAVRSGNFYVTPLVTKDVGYLLLLAWLGVWLAKKQENAGLLVEFAWFAGLIWLMNGWFGAYIEYLQAMVVILCARIIIKAELPLAGRRTGHA